MHRFSVKIFSKYNWF